MSATDPTILQIIADGMTTIRVRRILAGRRDIEERAMFGGLGFMARGHTCCGLVNDKLMVRVDPNAYDSLLGAPGVQPMDFTGRPMRGFLHFEPSGIASTPALRTWVGRALAFVEGLPRKARPKSRTSAPVRPKRRRSAAVGRRRGR